MNSKNFRAFISSQFCLEHSEKNMVPTFAMLFLASLEQKLVDRDCYLEDKWIENFVVPPNEFKKGPQKLSLLNLLKRDNIISLKIPFK